MPGVYGKTRVPVFTLVSIEFPLDCGCVGSVTLLQCASWILRLPGDIQSPVAYTFTGYHWRVTMEGRRITDWRLRTRTLALGQRTRVMGVVNITPDSFSDGGLYFAPEAAVEHALELLDEGADLLDLGAESTRPGSHVGRDSAAVSADEEQARLLPVIEGILKARPDAIISVDTYKAATARAALQAGAEIVNDVSGLAWDGGYGSRLLRNWSRPGADAHARHP